jgi:hypothetical protein
VSDRGIQFHITPADFGAVQCIGRDIFTTRTDTQLTDDN